MVKKCIICGEEAKFNIKDTSDYYCEECAEEHFGDVSVLVNVEEQAKKIKKLIEEKGKILDEPDDPDAGPDKKIAPGCDIPESDA